VIKRGKILNPFVTLTFSLLGIHFLPRAVGQLNQVVHSSFISDLQFRETKMSDKRRFSKRIKMMRATLAKSESSVDDVAAGQAPGRQLQESFSVGHMTIINKITPLK
jgi:hypothetical protein